MKKVFIIQNIIPNYREPVFKKLAEKLDLTVFYSNLSSKAKSRSFVQKKEFTGFKTELLTSLNIRGRVYQFSFLKHIIGKKPDVVIAQNFGHLDMLLALILCKILALDFYWWRGGAPYIGKDKPLTGTISKLFGEKDPRILISKLATGMFVYTKYAKTYLQQKGFKCKIIVAPNSPDTNNFVKLKKKYQENPVLINDLKNKCSPNGEKVMLLVGRLDKTRRTNDLIKAFHQIIQQNSNVSLVIVGGGSERAKNEQEVKKLGLKNVYFEGAIYDDELLAKYYMISDFFITPGVASMAIKIAMLFGLPVITANYGLEVHVIKNSVNGYVYPIGEFKHISNLIIHLINDSDSYCRISSNAIKTIENDVNINRMTEAFVKEIYKK